MHEQRRTLGMEYKEAAPPLFREYIYAATEQKYGDPLGPTFEMLRQTKTLAQIIASASRPIEDLDNRLTMDGFRKWYRESKNEEKSVAGQVYIKNTHILRLSGSPSTSMAGRMLKN